MTIFRSLFVALLPVVLLPIAGFAQETQPTSQVTLDLDRVAEEATAILLKMQEAHDGAKVRAEWPYEGVYREDQKIPIGYRVGGTSIGAIGLIESGRYAKDPAVKEAVRKALEFVLNSLDDPMMAEAFNGTYDVRGWGHAYALFFLLRLRDAEGIPAELSGKVKSAEKWLVDTLEKSAIPDSGGWNYSRRSGYRSPKNGASPFMTAPTLQVLFYAAARGHKPDVKVIESALDALERARNESGGYDYTAPVKPQPPTPEEKLQFMDKLPGSIGRMVAVESTLVLAGRGDQKRLTAAVDAFFEHWQNLEVRRKKTGTHIQPYGVAPYYFMYGHYFAAQAIELVEDKDFRDSRRSKLAATLAQVREADGGWNDRVFPRSEGFGTAMALLALRMKDLPKIPAFKPAVKN